MPHTAQRVVCLPQRAQRAAVIIPVEGIVRLRRRRQKLLRVTQKPPAAVQLLLFAGPQLCPSQLLDLIAQRVHAALFLRLVHLQRLHLPPYSCKVFILLIVCG